MDLNFLLINNKLIVYVHCTERGWSEGVMCELNANLLDLRRLKFCNGFYSYHFGQS